MSMCWTGDASAADFDPRGLRESLQAYLNRHCAEDGDFGCAQQIIGELVCNLVQHAPGPFCIDFAWPNDVPTIVVHDAGPGFDPQVAMAQPWHEERGRGLFIIGQFGGNLTATKFPGGCMVTVTLPLKRKLGHQLPALDCPQSTPLRRGQLCGRLRQRVPVG